jgi:hypothetical protein
MTSAEEEARLAEETAHRTADEEAALALAQAMTILHQQAVAIQNIKVLMPIVLDFSSTNYTLLEGPLPHHPRCWCKPADV